MNFSLSPTKLYSDVHRHNLHAETPQPKRYRQKNDEDLINTTLSEIAETTSQITEMSAKNTEAHTKCVKLQHELSSITRSLDKNVDFLQQICKSQEEENSKLKEELIHRQNLSEKMQNLIDQCSECGIDVRKIPGIDKDMVSEYFVVNEPINEGSAIDPFAKSIIDSNSYFEGVESNDEFIEKCVALKEEVLHFDDTANREKANKDELNLLRKQLAELQKNNSAIQAKMASEMNKLMVQKQMLLKELMDLKQKRNVK